MRKAKDDEKPKIRVAPHCRVSSDMDEQAHFMCLPLLHWIAEISFGVLTGTNEGSLIDSDYALLLVLSSDK